MDRVFRQQGISPHDITPMDRLAYIGKRSVGALWYSPALDYLSVPGGENEENLTSMITLGEEAERLFEGEAEEVLAALANAGGSGGARPKALIYFDPGKPESVSTFNEAFGQAWLLKFTSRSLPSES